MELTEVESVTSIATDIIQAVAVVVAALIAGRGLTAWRDQLIGGKLLELAEETLVAAYDAYDSLQRARMSGAFGGEGASRPRGDGEDAEVERRRDGYYVPIERLRAEATSFERLRSAKARCRIYFGENSSTNFNTLLSAQFRIAAAAHFLIRNVGEEDRGTPEVIERRYQKIDEYEKIIWDSGSEEEPDEFTQRLRDALKSIDNLLRPHLKITKDLQQP